MSLCDLSLPGALHTEELNALLADRCRVELPQGAFTVIARSFAGLARGRECRPAEVSFVVALRPEARRPLCEAGIGLQHTSDPAAHNQN